MHSRPCLALLILVATSPAVVLADGTACRFDGSNDFISLPNNFLPWLTSPTTVEMWFKTTGSGVLLGQQTAAPFGAPSGHAPILYVGQDGKLRAEYWWDTSGPIASPAIVNDGQPHHVAVTYDMTTFRVYLDAVQVVEKTTGLVSYSSQYYYQLGTGKTDGWPSAPSGWFSFNGQIDEVRAWSVAHTAGEICGGLYRTLTGNEPGLIGYWRLDEGSGQIAADASPMGNDGVLGANSDAAGDASDPTWVAPLMPALNPALDPDGDQVSSVCDNCPLNPNPDQANHDTDASGDACDIDDDNDGLADATDNCPLDSNPLQTNSDGDPLGDVCDNCPDTDNTDQADADGDGFGDACDVVFNAPLVNGSFETGPNPGSSVVLSAGSIVIAGWTVSRQTIDYIGTLWKGSDGVRSVDLDGNTLGGGVRQSFATVPGQPYSVLFDLAGESGCGAVIKRMRVEAAGQSGDFSVDTTGHDRNNMGWESRAWQFTAAAAMTTIEFYSLTTSGASCGAALDNIWVVQPPAGTDADLDGVEDALDNCLTVINTSQIDTDGDGLGDACDNCPDTPNLDQVNLDYDDIGDACDPIAGVWTTPVIATDINSGDDWNVAISPDGLTIYIGSERDGFAANDVYVATRASRSQRFSYPVVVPGINIPGYENHDLVGDISDNGLRIYFQRAVGHGQADYYVSERSSITAPWNNPTPIASINSAGFEYYMVVSTDELYTAFSSNRTGQSVYYDADRLSIADQWSNIRPISALAGLSGAPVDLSADSLALYIDAPGPKGGADIWVVKRSSASEPWGEPLLVPELCSSVGDWDVAVPDDGLELYLTRENPGSQGSIYVSYLIPALPAQVAADLDGDGDVDFTDFGLIQVCITNPGEPIAPGCEGADLDTDGDVDDIDIDLLLSCLSGANQPADPKCQDPDRDGYPYTTDNCLDVFNPWQFDADGDGAGDECDNCPTANADQADTDSDGRGDACDNCPGDANADQADADADGVGNACDNCPTAPNADQADADSDGIGDACEADCDGDGTIDDTEIADCTGDPACSDCNANGVPDGCELDAAFIAESDQLAPIGAGSPQAFILTAPPVAQSEVTLAFAAQADLSAVTEYITVDLNGTVVGTVFQTGASDCPATANTAELIVPAEVFNEAAGGGAMAIGMTASAAVSPTLCRGSSFISVAVQYLGQGGDCNGNGVPDGCEPDLDGDGVTDVCDNCPSRSNAGQVDTDFDGYGDACDNCPGLHNSSQLDTDADGVGNACDNCIARPNPNQQDTDADGLGNACDSCPGDANPDQTDVDHDVVGDACDNCLTTPNADQADGDSDGVGDACDACLDTTPGAAVDQTGCMPVVPGDFDHDGDVDADDAATFIDCAAGPTIGPLTAGCEPADLDGDNDADQVDFGIFQGCLSGQDRVGNPNCAE